jgi:dihydrofolate synthase/folylpolyglutamate synthase
MLAASGLRVGAYTSPHLLRYNERVRIDGIDADDAALVDAFTRIEHARGADAVEPIALTYFEFGTLAALLLFADAGLDVAVLEVGLGGRLDAVNLVDADAAIVTTVDLDHQDWLGADRDTIGREKAGIFRAGRPAIFGEAEPPQGLLEAATRIGAVARRAGLDYAVARRDGGWSWTGWSEPELGTARVDVPNPGLAGACQVDNAAAAIAALYALRDRLGWNAHAIARGVAGAHAAARLQRHAGLPEVIIDVAHNPQAARTLAAWLGSACSTGRTHAVFGALGDKDVDGITAALAPYVDAWFLAGLDRDSPRGLPASGLAERAVGALAHARVSLHPDVASALVAASRGALPGDRVLAFGSFFVAAAALEFARNRAAVDALAAIQAGGRV